MYRDTQTFGINNYLEDSVFIHETGSQQSSGIRVKSDYDPTHLGKTGMLVERY